MSVRKVTRRGFLKALAGGAAVGAFRRSALLAADDAAPVNVLLLTADDMNYDSIGVYGCKVPGVTPNLDKLASEGLRFTNAHVTVAICQPCRETLMTGRYPHRFGAMGFVPINRDVATLQEQLRAAGYMNGILGKVPHLAPREKFCWDYVVMMNQLGQGRDPKRYQRSAREFFAKAKAARASQRSSASQSSTGKPFFLMANSHDPHRPFAGSLQERSKWGRGGRKPGRKRPADTETPGAGASAGRLPGVSRTYKPREVVVPGFLPDIPNVRKEIAEYYTSVHRCDESLGAVLRALDESGLAETTLVMFLSDHGMPLPFAKTNCYLNSTKTPWMVRWPGKVKPGTVDNRHLVSGIDFMPTILEATGLKQVEGMDGKSFVPVLTGGRQAGRDRVFTVLNRTAGRKWYPMRCVQDRKFGYIFNAWADGKTVFKNESQSGLTMNAMKAAARTDKAVAARVKLFLYRVPEEFYDLENDPNAMKNLIDDPNYRSEIDRLREALLGNLIATKDPQTEAFRKLLARQ